MADPRFFKRLEPFSLSDIAKLSESEVSPETPNDNKLFEDVATLEDAQENHISFFDNKKYLEQFKVTEAGACFVHPDFAQYAPKNTVCLLSENPYKSYALAAGAFYPDQDITEHPYAESAIIDKTAILGKNCIVDSGAVIGKNVEIGDNCVIGANAVLSHCIIGNNVAIYPGACIGQRGFGFAIDQTGFVTVPQLGLVIIEDNVEIGANSTIDRGANSDTVIGEGTRIDNLVQIGHNVKIGRNCVIVAQTGISGSTELGDFVMTGGQSGFAGHLKIGSGVRVGAQSGVIRDIPAGQDEYLGSPAMPIRQFMRQVATLSKLVKRKQKK